MLFTMLTIFGMAFGVAVKVWQHLLALLAMESIVRCLGELVPWVLSRSILRLYLFHALAHLQTHGTEFRSSRNILGTGACP